MHLVSYLSMHPSYDSCTLLLASPPVPVNKAAGTTQAAAQQTQTDKETTYTIVASPSRLKHSRKPPLRMSGD